MTDAMQTEKTSIANEIRSMQQNVTEQALLQDTVTTGNEVQGLPGRLQTLRQRGYVYSSDLEQLVATLAKQWQDAQDDIRYRAQRRSQRLLWDLNDLQDILNRLNTAEATIVQNNISRLNGEITRLRTEIQNSKTVVMQAAGNVADQLRILVERITGIETYMKHVSEASFPFNAGESVYIAAKADWKKGKDNKENPEGVLYITNQRVIMEQNEKKGGLMGIGGNKVQQFLWDVPLSAVQGVSSENKGLFGNIDLVHIRVSAGTPAPEAIIEVKDGLKADWFANQVQRVQRGDAEKERIATT